MEAQQSDFQSWSNLESSGFRNGSFNVLSIKRKRMHNELVFEEDHQKELAWQRENVSLRTRRRADRERRSQSRTSSIGYNLERTPVRDKHANGVAERTVAKTNVAMMSPNPTVPQSYWDFAMAYACDTHSYSYSSVIGTSPYMKITGQPVDIKYLQPFWSACYVFIPRQERNKVGSPRAYKAHFIGYANTNLLFPNYIVVPVGF
jgi:hypothetical protein